MDCQMPHEVLAALEDEGDAADDVGETSLPNLWYYPAQPLLFQVFDTSSSSSIKT